MAHHQSAKKRIRQTKVRRLRNRYQAKTARNALRDIMEMDKKSDVEKSLPSVIAGIDKMVKKNLIHKNKGSHLKSKVMRHLNNLS